MRCSIPRALLLCLFASSLWAAPHYDNLVDIRSVDPTIRVDLQYARPRTSPATHFIHLDAGAR